VDWEDATDEVTTLLRLIQLEDFQHPEVWKELTILVQVEPDDDILPVRSKYDGLRYSLGLNHLTYRGLWHTLADCIASTLLKGQPPKIVSALRFLPKGLQTGLKQISIMGNPAYSVDPVKDDFYRRLIDLRTEKKIEMKDSSGHDRERLDTEQLALKICANATSSGIFVEVNTADYDRPQEVTCYGFDGNSFSSFVKTVEETGRYFHPLLASLITGAARLMLAVTEVLAEDAGITWAFCDTDSMALAKPEDMTEGEFLHRAQGVPQWFTPLNPYRVKGPLLRIEDLNYEYEEGRPTDKIPRLFCWAVSAKRHALFHLNDRGGRPVIRKASAHGLGHRLPPYAEGECHHFIPAPSFPLEEIGDSLSRWHYDLWYLIIVAGLSAHPRQAGFDTIEQLDEPAASRYTATTPRLLDWFKRYNKGKPYAQQVKPFNFLFALQCIPDPKRIRKARNSYCIPELLPVAPYNRDLQKAIRKCFDRNTGLPIPRHLLKTYREVLSQYHLHPEAKFHQGDYIDAGFTRRRHIFALGIDHIGKETNRWEEQSHLGRDDEAQINYGLSHDDSAPMLHSVQQARQQFGLRRLARASTLSEGHLSRILRGEVRLTSTSATKLLEGVRTLEEEDRDHAERTAKFHKPISVQTVGYIERKSQ
jgi:hypothetical protein